MKLNTQINFNNLIILICLFLFIILRYQGLNHSYVSEKFFQNFIFIKDDIYLPRTNLSFVYSIFNYNFLNDYYFFIHYFLFSIISLFFTFKILYKHCNVSKENSIIILLAFVGLDSFIFYDTESSLAFYFQSPTSIFSWSLFPIFLFFLIEKKFFISLLLTCFSLLFSLKFGIFKLILIIYINLLYQFNIKKIITIFFSSGLIALLYYKKIVLNLDLANNHLNDFMFSYFSENEEINDYVISKGRPLYQFLLISSLSIFFLIKDKLSTKIKPFFLSIAVCTVLIILFSTLYFEFLYKFYPNYKFFLLSPVSQIAYFQFIFALTILVLVFNSKYFFLTKILFLYFIIYFNGSEHIWISKYIGLSFLILSIFFEKLFKLFKSKYDYKKIAYSLILIFFLPILYVNFERLNSKFNLKILLESNKGFSNVSNNDKLLNSLNKLRKCENIFLVIFYRNNTLNDNQHLLSLGKYPKKNYNLFKYDISGNLIANKSFFYENNMSFFDNKEKYSIHEKRKKIINFLENLLNKGEFDQRKISNSIGVPAIVLISDKLNNNEKLSKLFINFENVNKNCYKKI